MISAHYGRAHWFHTFHESSPGQPALPAWTSIHFQSFEYLAGHSYPCEQDKETVSIGGATGSRHDWGVSRGSGPGTTSWLDTLPTIARTASFASSRAPGNKETPLCCGLLCLLAKLQIHACMSVYMHSVFHTLSQLDGLTNNFASVTGWHLFRC